MRRAAVVDELAILIERVAVFEVAVAGDVPLVPSPRDVAAPGSGERRHVPVEILAHHRGAISGLLHCDRPGARGVAEPHERAETSVGCAPLNVFVNTPELCGRSPVRIDVRLGQHNESVAK